MMLVLDCCARATEPSWDSRGEKLGDKKFDNCVQANGDFVIGRWYKLVSGVAMQAAV